MFFLQSPCVRIVIMIFRHVVCPRMFIGIVIFVMFVMTILYKRPDLQTTLYKPDYINSKVVYEEIIDEGIRDRHRSTIQEYIKLRQGIVNSTLGRILYQNETPPTVNTTNKYSILIWKSGPRLEKRHIYNYGDIRIDPFEKCSASNCELTYADSDFATADAVLFHLHSLSGTLPKRTEESSGQIWIFLTDEAPPNTFSSRPRNDWMHMDGIFNWSMSYRTDSDIPVAYGRTVPLEEAKEESLTELIPNWKKKRRDVLVAIVISNCNGERVSYVKELRKHVRVDVYGHCQKQFPDAIRCPGHYNSDCPFTNDYLFYLAFENSKCYQYMTEKLFWSSYGKGAIPVILGSQRSTCDAVLPPKSFLHVNDFARPADLARYILFINRTESLLKYHRWRRDFEVLNEHGYFQSASVHYCRICEALNYNERMNKTYNIGLLSKYLDVGANCD